jgi:alanyl-tRNA synthetase
MITRKELIKKYIDFFVKKGHKLIPNSSLVPSNDPTVLFTTAGMHPLVPYLLGEKHPLGKRLVGVQKCIRTTDIELVGDESHHTFFEMLGNWSLGDYWKEDAIKYSHEFLAKILRIPGGKISVTCFAGDKDASRDNETADVWKSLGIKKIKFMGKEDNWWGPAGETGPCGPDTEMFVNSLEIWNDVFMQYSKTKDGRFLPLSQKNVDTGMGVERTLAVLNGFDDNYLTEPWQPIIKEIEGLSGKKYGKEESITKSMRIIADHIKAAVFIIADGVEPSNTGRGYVLRRLIRKAVYYGREFGIISISKIAEPIFKIYSDYEELNKNKKNILNVLNNEEDKFNKTLEKGIKKVEEIAWKNQKISGKDAFLLFQSHGVPLDVITIVANKNLASVDVKAFEQELAKHQELSRTASAGTFKSGLADHSEKTIKLHTAAHLLNEALRQVLGKEVRQKGSNITPERLRFDFSFPRKLTEDETRKVEDMVNKKIKEGIKVIREEMPLKKAFESGAHGEFGAKYPDIVSVYTIGNFSKEICTGPHVKNTGEIGKFRIIKEESSSGGVRRIKAVVD